MEWIVGYVSPLRKLMHGFPSHAQWCDEAPVGYKGDSMLFEQVVLWSGDTKHARRLHFEREVWYDWHHAHSSRIGSPHCLEAGWSQARREMLQPSNFTLGLLGLAGIRHWDSVPGVTQSILAQVGWLMIFFLGSHGMVARIFFCLPVGHLRRGYSRSSSRNLARSKRCSGLIWSQCFVILYMAFGPSTIKNHIKIMNFDPICHIG